MGGNGTGGRDMEERVATYLTDGIGSDAMANDILLMALMCMYAEENHQADRVVNLPNWKKWRSHRIITAAATRNKAYLNRYSCIYWGRIDQAARAGYGK